jgi:hypothetical protein
MKKAAFIVLFLLASVFVVAEEFDIGQLNKMAEYIGKDIRSLPYSFEVYRGDIKDVEFRFLSKRRKGGIFGLFGYAVGEALWADRDGTVFSARWVMDGTNKQEMEEYRSILLLFDKQLGKSKNSTATSTSWEWRNLGVYIEFKDDYVGVSVFNLRQKTLVQQLLDFIF